MNLIKTAQSIIEQSLPDDLFTVDHAYKETDYHHPDWSEVAFKLYIATEDVDYLYDTFGNNYDECWGRVCKSVVDELKDSDWYEELHRNEIQNRYS